MNALSGYDLATSPASNAARKAECDEQADRERQRNAEQAEIEARLGHGIGAIADMPRDIRRALYLLALQLQKHRDLRMDQ